MKETEFKKHDTNIEVSVKQKKQIEHQFIKWSVKPTHRFYVGG